MREGWEYKKLGDCFLCIKNGANIKQIKNADGFPITRIETLSGGVFNRDRMGYAGIHDLDKYTDYVLEDGDLLMSHINSKTYIGRTVEYKKDGNETIIHGMNLLRLKSNKSLIVSSFMAYYTLSAEFKANVAKIRKDAVNQSSMAISDLKRFLIPVPSLSIQQSIVSELDEINKLLSLKRKELETYDKLAQSLFYEMFGDPVENEKGWEVKKLGEVCVIITGSTPSTSDGSNWDGHVNWVTPAELDIQLYYGETKRKITEKAAKSLTIMPKGTVLLSTRAPIGKLAITTVPMCCNQGFKNMICKDELVNIFLYYYLLFTMDNIKAMGRGATFKEVSKNAINEYSVVLPPLSLQQLFAARIEAIEQQKANVKAAIEKLETLLAARMQYWFE